MVTKVDFKNQFNSYYSTLAAHSSTRSYALMGGSSSSMTSCKLLEEEEGSTLERSPRQVSRLGSFRAVLTKSLYVTWENNGEAEELVE